MLFVHHHYPDDNRWYDLYDKYGKTTLAKNASYRSYLYRKASYLKICGFSCIRKQKNRFLK